MSRYPIQIDINQLRNDLIAVMQRHSLSKRATAQMLKLCYITLQSFLNGKNNIQTSTMFTIKNFVEQYK